MRLGRIQVLLIGLAIIIALTCATQVVDYVSMEVTEAVYTGYKEGKTCITFETKSGPTEACREFPVQHFTGDKVKVLYDPAEPQDIRLIDFGYWLDQQYFPMLLIVAWIAFSLAYVGRGQVLIIGQGGLFRRAPRHEAHYFRGENRELE